MPDTGSSAESGRTEHFTPGLGRRWLSVVRLIGVVGLVVSAVLAVAVPITIGLFAPPDADIGFGWCGTLVFRSEHPDCPTCCVRHGVYRDRGVLVLVIAFAAVSALGISLMGSVPARLRARSARSRRAGD